MFIINFGLLLLNSVDWQDGLLRVILDGGSTRVFSPNDAPLLEEDLETLKVISFCKFYPLLVLFYFIS
jgi:hypothetical protein